MGENGLDEAQHAALMALTPKELSTQASLCLQSLRSLCSTACAA